MTVTLITGASSGIGRSLALALSAGGDAVAVLARRADLLQSLVAEIEIAGGRAMSVACDVTDRQAVRDAIRTVEHELGPVERLIANAGGGEPTDSAHLDAAHVADIVALNLMGAVYCIEAVLPGMLQRKQGHLVAMSSLAAYRGLPCGGAYSAAKAALSNLMESLRIDLKPHGIDVTLLLPGFVRTSTGPKKAKRGKPFRLELADATERMVRAIRARRRRYAFPWTLAAVARLATLLPATLFDRLLAGRGRKIS
ncbi:MAG: SDR family NAD(P)-dependent oxidoreductase [Pseudomonadales bacterium]